MVVSHDHQPDPLVRVELGRCKHRNEVFVAELLWRPVLYGVIGEDALGVIARALVEIANIVRATVSRHGVDAPMGVHSELGIFDPVWKRVL